VLLRAFGLLLFLFGWSTSQAGVFDDEEARRQIAQQQVVIGNLRTQAQTLDERIVKLEELLGNQPLLELNNQIESLKLDLSKLQGQIEVLANENDQAQKRQKDFYVDLDSRLRKVEESSASQAPQAASSEARHAAATDQPEPDAEAEGQDDYRLAPPVSVSVRPSVPGAESEESLVYEAAYSQFKNGRYQDAISSFNKFLKSYPNSSLAPSAQYWIGNSYYAMRDFKNAISAQEKLISTFPESAKAPDAMLNIASSQLEMNKKPAAKKTLETVVRKYPGSDAADKAKKRLANLK
jgi:tol-pal system protein YbgF